MVGSFFLAKKRFRRFGPKKTEKWVCPIARIKNVKSDFPYLPSFCSKNGPEKTYRDLPATTSHIHPTVVCLLSSKLAVGLSSGLLIGQQFLVLVHTWLPSHGRWLIYPPSTVHLSINIGSPSQHPVVIRGKDLAWISTDQHG